jgi:hypothetical protein
MSSVGKQLLTTMNPWAYLTDSLDVSKLPRMSNDDQTNQLMWNSLGSTVSIGSIIALSTALAHRLRKRKWDDKEKTIIKNKVNTLHPIITPNYDEDNTDENEEVRLIGIKKSANDNNDKKEAEDFVAGLKRMLVGSIPIAVGSTVALTASGAANKYLSKKESKTLDTEIAGLRNEIDALHARLIDLKSAKSKKGLNKSANNLHEALGTALGALIAVGGPLTYITLAQHMKKSDKYERMVEAAEDLASENLTNIPQELSVRLTDEGRSAVDSTEMSYLPELIASANRKAFKEPEESHKENIEDFDDKVTKLKKEDLFA